MTFDVVEYLQCLVNDPFAGVEEITSPYELPMGWRIEYEERAAILEYDGGLSREEADGQALQEIIERLRQLGNGQGAIQL